MKKRIRLIIGVVLMLIGLFIAVNVAARFIAPPGSGALQVNSNIKATVLLNEKNIGETNLCLCGQDQTVPEGEHTLKIIPNDTSLQPFTTKIKIYPNVLTAVERTFLPGSFASSYVLNLEKTGEKDASLLVSSLPDGALVALDGNQVGATTYFAKAISASEHQIEIQKQGFGKKTIRIRTVAGYKLVINVILGTDSGTSDEAIPTPEPTTAIASPSATLATQVKIKETPNNFLNVREETSINSPIITKVRDGETYEFVDEKESWFQIKLPDGTTGWISSTYAEKVTE
jgi:hypothetical protein